MGRQRKSKKTRFLPAISKARLQFIGNLLIFLALFILLLTFWPVMREEAKYNFNQVIKPVAKQKELAPPNTDFSILIPKIGASAAVFANIDSQDPKKFLPVLQNGVAHAKGSALPGQTGNVYLFAHSTDAFYNVGSYNAVFYLIGKLKRGDEISIYYKGKKNSYVVSEVKVVGAGDSQYLGNFTQGDTLTLQTCYPPGTTLKRLIVLANQVH